MRVPKLNSLWLCVANAPGRGDTQGVIATGSEVVTMSARELPEQIDWSWLGPADMFYEQFRPAP